MAATVSASFQVLCSTCPPLPLSVLLELPVERWGKDVELKEMLAPVLSAAWEVQPVVERGGFFFYYGTEFLDWCSGLGATVTLSVPLPALTPERIRAAVSGSLHRLAIIVAEGISPKEPAGGDSWAALKEAVAGIREQQRARGTRLPSLRLESSEGRFSFAWLGEMIRQAAALGIGEVAVGDPSDLGKEAAVAASALARESGVHLILGRDVDPSTSLPSDSPGAASRTGPRYAPTLPLGLCGSRSFSSGAPDPWRLRARNLIKRCLYKEFSPEQMIDISRLRVSSERRKSCLYPWSWTVISRSGEVRACPVSKRVMGRLGERAFERIWLDEAYAGFRERILSPDPPGECVTCALRGWFRPYELTDWLWMCKNDQFGVNLGTGWHDREPGLPYRWSRREARLRLKNSRKKKLGLVLHLPGRALSQRGEVWIDGGKAGAFHLKRPGDRLLYYDVPASDREEIAVRLLCEREIVPRRVLGNDDLRRLGAAFKGAFLE